MTTYDKSQLRADLENVIAKDPHTLGYDGQSANGIKTIVRKEIREMAAGEQYTYRFSVRSVLTDWTTNPPVDAVLTVDGTEYRVMDREIDCLEISVIHHMGAKYQR